MKTYYRYIILLFVLLSNLLIIKASPKTENGILDLRMWDGVSTQSLDGEWMFFWEEFIEPNEFSEIQKSQNSEIVEVPSYWSDYEIDGEFLPGNGFCTYGITVLLPNNIKNNLALDIPVFDDSYTLFLNGQLVSQNGKPGMSEVKSEPGYQPKLLLFESEIDKLEIVIHVANFAHRRGGFWKSIRIGDADKFIHQKNTYELICHSSLGLIIAFTLFFLFFYIFYPRNIKALFFSLMLVGMLLRLIATDTFPILVFGRIPWDWLIRFEYLGSFIALAFVTWYFLTLYPGRIMKIIVMMNSVIIGLIIMFIVISKPVYFAYTMFYFKPVVLLFFAYYLGISFIHIFKREEGDEYYFATIFILLISLVNDIRISSSSTGLFNDYATPFAVQLFILTHAILVIRTWVKAFKEKEKLNLEIEFLNLNLEKRIKVRTKEIVDSKREIEKQHEEIGRKNEKLKLNVDLNNKIQSIIAHDLRSPIVSVFQISDYFAISNSTEGLKETIQSIRELSGSASALIDNVLFWGRSQQGKIHFSPEQVKISDLISESMILNKLTLKQKSVNTETLITKNLEVYGDINLLKIIFRNLFSNALKYSKKKGEITITAARPKKSENVVIIIEDKGIGIPPAILKVLNSTDHSDNIESRKGTSNEKGSGLGIRLSQELMQINNGKMKIESEEGKGTRVMLFLPGSQV